MWIIQPWHEQKRFSQDMFMWFTLLPLCYFLYAKDLNFNFGRNMRLKNRSGRRSLIHVSFLCSCACRISKLIKFAEFDFQLQDELLVVNSTAYDTK